MLLRYQQPTTRCNSNSSAVSQGKGGFTSEKRITNVLPSRFTLRPTWTLLNLSDTASRPASFSPAVDFIPVASRKTRPRFTPPSYGKSNNISSPSFKPHLPATQRGRTNYSRSLATSESRQTIISPSSTCFTFPVFGSRPNKACLTSLPYQGTTVGTASSICCWLTRRPPRGPKDN